MLHIICIITSPCLGTDVPAVVGSRSLCILAQGMRLDLVGIGKAGQSARIEPKPRARLVWSDLALKDAWVPHSIPNYKRAELRLGYHAFQLIGICIVTLHVTFHAQKLGNHNHSRQCRPFGGNSCNDKTPYSNKPLQVSYSGGTKWEDMATAMPALKKHTCMYM